MAAELSTSARNTSASAVAALLNGGTVQFRSGTRPANPQTSATGTLLATATLPNPAFGSASSGVVTANAISPVTAAASGTPTWFRAFTSGGAAVFDGDVSLTAGSGDAKFDVVDWVAGGQVEVTSFTYTQPAS